ncbi:MAG: SDR family NAD(P)-dependent oxidoreductase, partial [Clostridia bacterium]|nr:SDR family NAD(P)-dependent oxidoreductase [Clostridia bacterium]
MKIAVITGASSGLGKEFVKAITELRPDIEEIWLVARREDKLKEVAASIKAKSRILSLDITD